MALVPPGETFLKYMHIPIAETVQVLVGQTGQVVWAVSIQDDRDIARNFCDTVRHLL